MKKKRPVTMLPFNFPRRIAFTLITLLICVVAFELVSAEFLFRYYAVLGDPLFASGSAGIYLVKKAFGIPVFDTDTSVDPQPLYVPDPLLGYTTRPGRYRVGFSALGKTLYFNFTVPQQGVRLTSYSRRPGGNSIYVFGDSFILGWGNNDEQTMPWLLQERFPTYNVVNLAQNGYGTTQAVIQYQRIEENVGKDDIIVLSYGDYFLVRNSGAPSYMRKLSQGVKHRLAGPVGFADIRWPAARSGPNGELAIDYVKVFCGNNGDYCDRDDPKLSDMVDGTKAILRFFSKVKPKVILAFNSGADDDPVVAYAREIGIPVADIRLDIQSPEWDNFEPFDGHPAAIAQYNYYQKLANALIVQRLVSIPDKE